MSDSNSAGSRPVLKLKVSRAARAEIQKPVQRGPQGKIDQKPGAAWSDELKRQMQEDMNALARR